MEILFFIILTAVISSFIEYYRDKNKYFRAREEGSIKKVKDFLSGNKHRDLAHALEKIKEYNSYMHSSIFTSALFNSSIVVDTTWRIVSS